MSNILFLVGNGLNHYVLNYLLENPKTMQEKLSGQGDELDHYEDLLKAQQSLIDLFSAEEAIPNLLEDSEHSFSHFVSDISKEYDEDGVSKSELVTFVNHLEDYYIRKARKRIYTTTLPRRGQFNKRFYYNASIRTCFKEDNVFYSDLLYDAFAKVFENPQIKVLSTNYDENAAAVFGEKNSGTKNPKIFYESIHGSFFTGFNNKNLNCKLNHEIEDENARMVLTAPSIKKRRLKEFGRLELLQKSIDEADCIYIFGLGLTSDPHIADLINAKADGKIVLIDHKTKKDYLDYANDSNNEHKDMFMFVNDVNRTRFIQTTDREGFTKHPNIILERCIEEVQN